MGESPRTINGFTRGGNHVEPAGDGLEQVWRGRGGEVELAADRARQQRQVLHRLHRHVEAVFLEDALILGDPSRQPGRNRHIGGAHRRQLLLRVGAARHYDRKRYDTRHRERPLQRNQLHD
jgi:hypothetical protein